ncbi:hypothetical protein ACN27F_33175 [Solwaraspora sp. WMMB335]|uniref:hypothetical protein n=1 Tax=Solwaraspora sp. WMMB335 TaxID=3404118 RepID=UPI003B956412
MPGGLEGHTGEPRRYLVPADLPPPPTILLGRDWHIEEIRRKLARPNGRPTIVVLSGPTGIGRSALAITVAGLLADSFPDGQVLVDADGRPDMRTGDVLDAVYWALREPARGDEPPPADLELWYRQRTAELAVLVILDNFTRLDEIRRLLPAGERCALIITSPGPIRGLDAHVALTLGRLDQAPAREALLELLGRSEPMPDRESAAVDTIVEATARYPVALHIAGAALAGRRSWTLELAVERMREVAANRDEDPDLTPFAGALDLSFAMLTKQERQGLVLLGLLGAAENGHPENVASWMLAALMRGCANASGAGHDREPPVPEPAIAQGLLDDLPAGRRSYPDRPWPGANVDPADDESADELPDDGRVGSDDAALDREDHELRTARQLLERLANARLAHQRFDSVGVVTYRVPDYVRTYARAHLIRVLSSEQQAAAEAMLQAERERRGERRPADLLAGTVYRLLDDGRLAAALDAARDAVTHARHLRQRGSHASDAGEALGLAALAEIYAELGWIEEGAACAEAALRAEDRSAASESRARRALGNLRNRQHKVDEGAVEIAQALRIARQIGDVKEEIRVLRERSVNRVLAGRAEQALAAADSARELCGHAGGSGARLLPSVLWAYAGALLATGSLDEAAETLREADRRTRVSAHGRRLWRPWIRHQRALVALRAGRYEEGRKYGFRALDGFTEIRHRYGVGHSRLAIGRALLAERRTEAATAVLEEALITLRTCGDRWMEAEAATVLALAQQLDFQRRRSASAPPRARQLLLAAQQTFARLGDVDGEVRSRRLLDDLESIEVAAWPEPVTKP